MPRRTESDPVVPGFLDDIADVPPPRMQGVRRMAPSAEVDCPIVGVEDLLRVDLSLLDENPENHRLHFDEDDLSALAADIQVRGLLDPLRVRRSREAPGRYVIEHGHRRYRALRKLAEAACYTDLVNPPWIQVPVLGLETQHARPLTEDPEVMLGRHMDRHAEDFLKVKRQPVEVARWCRVAMDLAQDAGVEFTGERIHSVTGLTGGSLYRYMSVASALSLADLDQIIRVWPQVGIVALAELSSWVNAQRADLALREQAVGLFCEEKPAASRVRKTLGSLVARRARRVKRKEAPVATFVADSAEAFMVQVRVPRADASPEVVVRVRTVLLEALQALDSWGKDDLPELEP